MNKNITYRIAYYTKKVAEFGSIHPSKKQPKSYTYRHKRLMSYKKLMSQKINQSK
jgi:hypothetical protein